MPYIKINNFQIIYQSNFILYFIFFWYKSMFSSFPNVLLQDTCLAFDGIPHRNFVSKPIVATRSVENAEETIVVNTLMIQEKSLGGINVAVWISWTTENSVDLKNKMHLAKFHLLKRRFSNIFLIQLLIFRFRHYSNTKEYYLHTIVANIFYAQHH